jgi:hypothetical protein
MAERLTIQDFENMCVGLIDKLRLRLDKVVNLRPEFGRFRILIVGRANAGKTTILKKVCNSIEDPEILTSSGKKVMQSALVYNIDNDPLLPAGPHNCSGILRGPTLKYTYRFGVRSH